MPDTVSMINTPGAQALINDAFSPEFIQRTVLDVQHKPLYDTLTFANNTPIVAGNQSSNGLFFTVVQGKNAGQTNMTRSQELPNPEAFAIMSCRIRLAEDLLLTDALGYLNSFALNLQILRKSYNQAPAWHYGAGGGLTGFGLATTIAAAPTNPISVITNGMPGRQAMLKLALTLPLENGVQFFVFHDGQNYTTVNAGGLGIRTTYMFDGLWAWGVQ